MDGKRREDGDAHSHRYWLPGSESPVRCFNISMISANFYLSAQVASILRVLYDVSCDLEIDTAAPLLCITYLFL